MLRAAAVGLALAGATALAGCGDGASDPDDASTGSAPAPSGQPDRIVVAAGDAPQTLDPARAQLRSERIIASAIQTPLLTHPHRTGDDAAALVPALARSLPRLTADRLEYRFALRPGLVYADGRLVKASDVERAIAHASKAAADQELRDVLSSIVGAPSTDGQTLRGVRSDDRNGAVVVRLRAPDGRVPLALADPATAPLPELPRGNPRALPSSTGPLRVARVTKDSVELVANPLRAKIDSVPAARTSQVAVVGSWNSRELATGAVGVALTAEPRDWVMAGAPRAKVVAAASGAVWALLLPAGGPFAERSVREALAKAVDRRPFKGSSPYRAACALYPAWIAGATPQDGCPPVPSTSKDAPLLGVRVRLATPVRAANLVAFDEPGRDTPASTTPAASTAGNTPSTTTPTTPPLTQPGTPDAAAVDALQDLGAAVTLRSGRGRSAEQWLAQGLADAALVRIRPSLPHPAGYLAPVEPLDALIDRETDRLVAMPLTGAGGDWAKLERRALARAVAVPVAATVDSAAVGYLVEPRSVVLHPVLGLDLAALRLR